MLASVLISFALRPYKHKTYVFVDEIGCNRTQQILVLLLPAPHQKIHENVNKNY